MSSQSASQPTDRLLGDFLANRQNTGLYDSTSLRKSRVEINDEFLHGESDSSAAIRTDYFGETIRNVNKRSYTFLVLMLIELLALLTMSLYHVWDDFPVTSKTRSDFVYSLVLALNILFCMYYVIHGVLKERSIELFTFLAGSLILTAYVIYEFVIYNGDRELENRKWRMIVCCLCEPFNIIGAMYVARGFGWVNFIIIGADMELGAVFDTLCTYFAMFKINLQMALSLIALSFFSQDMAFDYEWAIEAVAFSCLLLNSVISHYMFSREISMLRWYVLTSLAQPLYITWKLLEVSTVYPESYHSYVRLPVLIAGFTALMTYFLTVVWAHKARNGFGKGLRLRNR
ncbi:hypothetical protein, variant [Sphaeroforma arctica JP610]|uniref:DUF7789 domain-containing protein n=1 Tax=Sphaeroforma arctica JP610 TaxID=667725 RepID=A0A0L0FTB7_9EUKA|nr:hypothetical protein, variant [Sphaeroforma arctica JP610]KNC80027.1 hypothetical protein, variant [Sphaeroforma arctica JP610]|eukprot:XP_014153929.1 hypothetical protein, variant [Sphaeroforma arctica JP610]